MEYKKILNTLFETHEEFVKTGMTHEDSELYMIIAKRLEKQIKNHSDIGDVSESPIQWIKANKELPMKGTYYAPKITYVQCAMWIAEYVKKHYSR
jgi:hypothetical protein